MSTPDSTNEASTLEDDAREQRDTLTQSVGHRLEATPTKAPWWKRLLGRG